MSVRVVLLSCLLTYSQLSHLVFGIGQDVFYYMYIQRLT